MESQELKDYVMPFNEFMQFLQTHNPDTFLPDGQYMMPVSALNQLGYVVWLVSDALVERLRRGV